MNSSSGEPARWQKLSSEVRFKTRIFEVTAARFRHGPRGTTREFSVINAADWVNVVAVTVDGKLVLVRQFRYGINDLSLEIPGGVMEPGEDPVSAGCRELEEETGFTGRGRLLGSVHPNPAIQSNRCHFVVVEDARQTHPLGWDEDEELQLVTMPVDDVYTLARQGGITHSLVLDALFLFQPHWEKRRSSNEP